MATISASQLEGSEFDFQLDGRLVCLVYSGFPQYLQTSSIPGMTLSFHTPVNSSLKIILQFNTIIVEKQSLNKLRDVSKQRMFCYRYENYIRITEQITFCFKPALSLHACVSMHVTYLSRAIWSDVHINSRAASYLKLWPLLLHGRERRFKLETLTTRLPDPSAKCTLLVVNKLRGFCWFRKQINRNRIQTNATDTKTCH